MRKLNLLLLAIVVAGCGSRVVADQGASADDAGSLAAADAGALPACMAGLPDAGPLEPVWTYQPSDPDTKLIFNGVVDDHDNLYWAECNQSCQLVSATRDGAIRFRADLGASFNNVAFAGGNVLVAADCFVEAFSTDGHANWIFDLRSGLGSTCQNAGVSFAELHDGKVLVAAQERSNRFAVRLDQAGLPSSWSGPVLMSSLSGGAVALSVASNGRGSVFQTQLTTNPDGTTDGTTVATDETGNILWQVPAGGRTILTNGAAVFAGSNELSAVDGSAVYTLPTPHASEAEQSFLVAANGLAVVTRYIHTTCMYSPACTQTDVFPLAGGLDDAVRLSDAASDVLLTSRNTALFVSDPVGTQGNSDLIEADASGLRYACQLSLGYVGAYPHHPMALLPNRLVLAKPQMSTGASQDRMEIVAFDVPGISLAAHGWVTPQGNAGRSGRPQ